MPVRKDSTQVEILDAIVERLISQIDSFTDATCFRSLLPVPPPNLPVGTGAVVVPASGSFETYGGYNDTIAEDATVRVSIYHRINLDSVGRSINALNSAGASLLDAKRNVLRVLIDPTWEPEANGRSLLQSLIEPINAEGPDLDEQNNVAFVVLTFATPFVWRLDG